MAATTTRLPMSTRTRPVARPISLGAVPIPAATWTTSTCSTIAPTAARLPSQINPVASTTPGARRDRFFGFVPGAKLLHGDGHGADGAAVPARRRQRRRTGLPPSRYVGDVGAFDQGPRRGVQVDGAGVGLVERLLQPADVRHVGARRC